MKKHIKIKLFLFVMGFIASIGAWADRSWNYTYNTQGLIESSDGPRTDVSDVTAYTYDAAGNLQTVTNALNQVTTLQNYNAAGLPQTIVDINGTLTLLEYNWRGKVTKRTLQSTQGDAVTLFEYDPVGLLTKITLPDNTFLSYEHDDARRLIATVNNAGERLEYTKDAMGNVILEQIKDSAGTLLKTQSRVFDEMGRMIQSMGASAQTTAYSYDNNSNLTNTTNPLGNSATQSFDALQRLISQVDEKLGETQYAYDAQDNLTSVTDPRGINTTYLYDELGNLIQQSSPETGITLYSHDAAGNIISKTDARNVVTQYSYDALNRLLQVSYPANPSENITYSYDDASAGNKGLGRLTRIVDPSGTTQYRYDDRGNVVQDSKTLDSHTYTTDYGYDLADKLLSITYPSGQIVSYGYNSLGQVNRIDTQASATATQQTIMQNVEYLPFGGISVLTYGNGISYNLLHDQDYLITDLTSTAIDRTYQYDLTSNITNITDNQNSQRSEGFVYDELSRLIENQASDGTLTFDYDPVGNRTLLTTPNDQTTYSYPLDSNRLASNSWWNYEYDAVGNTTRQYDADGNQLVFAYNHRNRLSAVTKDSVTSTKVKGKWVYTTVSTQTNYEYNALGQRVIKSSDSADVYYLFNLQGQVIAEADSLGNIQTEYVYLDG
ncbi:MAG: RHS repeat protein, partial [Gammaproteobacteria bacterium]|nr:RHS repeat protein [Gammaproteobacteria bacterium]